MPHLRRWPMRRVGEAFWARTRRAAWGRGCPPPRPYHRAGVARGLHRVQGRAWLVAGLPSGSYAESREQALRSACVLMQAGAQMVKLEGGGWTAPTVEFLVQRGVPV